MAELEKVVHALPNFDAGIELERGRSAEIKEACGAVHYVKPDSSTLRDRKHLRCRSAQGRRIACTNPKAYRDGYISGIVEDRPAIICIKMQMARTAVNEIAPQSLVAGGGFEPPTFQIKG